MPEFKEKFIAFIDILGFRQLVDQSEAGKGLSLEQIERLLKYLGTPEKRDEYQKYGPKVCPESPHQDRNIDFQLTQISDCVIVSTEISPAGAINLVSHCWGSVISLLPHGIMCRGYITRGLIYHTPTQVIGSGYQKAYESERQVSVFKREADERGTPFVEIDTSVYEYIDNCIDSCTKTMLHRMVKRDSSGAGLYPFKQLSHSFSIGGFGQKFDPDKEKKSNDNLRKMLLTFRDRVLSYADKSNTNAFRKTKHYIEALDTQLQECDRTDEMIDTLCKPALGSWPRN